MTSITFGDAMFIEINRLCYNPDASYNEKYFNPDGTLKVSFEEYKEAEKLYTDMRKADHIKAWNEFHVDEWSYEKAEAWCKDNSANHYF